MSPRASAGARSRTVARPPTGEAAEVAGNVANGIPCEQAQEQDLPYADVVLEHTLTDPVAAGDDGTMWLLVGTDSGLERRTSLYYDRIEVTFTPTREAPRAGVTPLCWRQVAR